MGGVLLSTGCVLLSTTGVLLSTGGVDLRSTPIFVNIHRVSTNRGCDSSEKSPKSHAKTQSRQEFLRCGNGLLNIQHRKLEILLCDLAAWRETVVLSVASYDASSVAYDAPVFLSASNKKVRPKPVLWSDFSLFTFHSSLITIRASWQWHSPIYRRGSRPQNGPIRPR